MSLSLLQFVSNCNILSCRNIYRQRIHFYSKNASTKKAPEIYLIYSSTKCANNPKLSQCFVYKSIQSSISQYGFRRHCCVFVTIDYSKKLSTKKKPNRCYFSSQLMVCLVRGEAFGLFLENLGNIGKNVL